MKTSILAGYRQLEGAAQCGLSAPVSQSADRAGAAEAAQSPRLSSARANNSASFGSFPVLSRVSRFSMQEIAARRAGRLSPWHDQPEIRTLESLDALHEAEAGARPLGAADQAQQGHGAEFAVDEAGGLQLAHAARVHPGGDLGDRGPGMAEFAARAIDFELGDRLFVGAAPAEDILAAALGMPENLVSLCFVDANRTG